MMGESGRWWGPSAMARRGIARGIAAREASEQTWRARQRARWHAVQALIVAAAAATITAMLLGGCGCAPAHDAALALERALELEQRATVPHPALGAQGVALVGTLRAETRATARALVDATR